MQLPKETDFPSHVSGRNVVFYSHVSERSDDEEVLFAAQRVALGNAKYVSEYFEKHLRYLEATFLSPGDLDNVSTVRVGKHSRKHRKFQIFL